MLFFPSDTIIQGFFSRKFCTNFFTLRFFNPAFYFLVSLNFPLISCYSIWHHRLRRFSFSLYYHHNLTFYSMWVPMRRKNIIGSQKQHFHLPSLFFPFFLLFYKRKLFSSIVAESTWLYECVSEWKLVYDEKKLFHNFLFSRLLPTTKTPS